MSPQIVRHVSRSFHTILYALILNPYAHIESRRYVSCSLCVTFWLMRLCFHVDVSLSICLALRLSAPNQPFLVR